MHRSALGLALLLSACGPEKKPDVIRTIRAHALPACPVDASARLALTALGDFDADPRSFETLSVDARATEVAFPVELAAVVGVASSSAGAWIGLTEAGATGDFDLALWPSGTSCSLGPSDDAGYPGPPGGQAFGLAPASGVVLVAGGDSTDNIQASGAFAVSLETGEGGLVPIERQSNRRRAFATATALATAEGERVVVAGGFDPLAGDAARALGSADVFDPSERAFVGEIALIEPRARHAAVMLDGGVILLVGGQDELGGAKRTLEVVRTDLTTRIAGLASLEVPRIDPRALRLDDGRILVLGGVSDTGEPVTQIEWLAPDASGRARPPLELPARTDADVVALPGGGALVVGGCDPVADGCPSSTCIAGCPTRDVRWITPAGLVELLDGALTVDPGPAPELIAADDGSPFLVTPSGALRFDPWRSRFDPVDAPTLGADARSAAAPHPIVADPGLFVRLVSEGETSRVEGVRHSVRGRFVRDVAPLLIAGPEHVVPSIPPSSTSITYAPSAETSPSGAPGLVLTDSVARAVVTDALYADVRVEIELAAGTPPVVTFGESRFGDFDCPWPDEGRAEEREVLVVDRVRAVVALERRGRVHRCPMTPDRVSLGFAARTGETSTLGGVRVRRRPFFDEP